MSREMVEGLGLTDLDVTFIAEVINIVLVNLIHIWKTDVTLKHLILSQLDDFDGDNNLSRCIEVWRARRGMFYVLKGEEPKNHTLLLNIRLVDENGGGKNVSFPFDQDSDTASKVSTDMVEALELTDLDVTFITELIDVVLVRLIPTWKTDVQSKISYTCSSIRKCHQKEAKTQRQEDSFSLF